MNKTQETYVEVGEDDSQTSVLLSKHVLDRYLDVVEEEMSSPSCGRVLRSDGSGLNSLAPRHQEDGETVLRLATDREVIRKASVGDPLLRSVEDKVLAIRSPLSSGLHPCHVRSCKCFTDSERDDLLSAQDLVSNLLSECLGSEVENGGESNDGSSLNTVSVSSASSSHKLLRDDQLVEVVELLGRDDATHESPSLQPRAGTETHGVHLQIRHGLDDAEGGTLAVELTGEGIGAYDSVDKVANSGLELAVVVGVVWGGESLGKPTRLGIGLMSEESVSEWDG